MSYELILLRGAFLQDCGEMGKGQTEADSPTRGRTSAVRNSTNFLFLASLPTQ